jgi:hypothetical protein
MKIRTLIPGFIALVAGVAVALLSGCGSEPLAPVVAPEVSARPPRTREQVLPPVVEPVQPAADPATDTALLDAEYAAKLRKLADDFGPAALQIGKQACLKVLKSPATAKFSETGWSPYGLNQWKVSGDVDSQNSFGALVRGHFFAVVRRSGDLWSIPYFNLDGDEAGKMPPISVAPPRSRTPAELAAQRERATARRAAQKPTDAAAGAR